MNKTIFIFNLPDMNDLPGYERWFWRHHAPEVMHSAPWTTRYISYRAVPPPPGAESYGYYNYRVHENWSHSDEPGGHDPKGSLSMTPSPGRQEAISCTVPARPTEDFMGCGLRPEEKTILRWLILFKYPEGVPVEEGEDWFLNVHSKEVMQQPGLIRYFSYRTVTIKPPPPLAGQRPFARPYYSPPRYSGPTHRVSEQWYENNNGWVKSVIDSPPKYTKPPWAKYNKYPFLEPYVDFASTFILERPTDDFLRDQRPLYI